MKIRTQTSSHSGQTRRLVDGISAPIRSCWTDFSDQGSSPFDQIDQSQHGLNPFLDESPVGVLRQAAIANLGKAPQTLERQERMLDLGEQRRAQMVLFHQVTKVEQGRRIRCPFAAQIEPAEVSKHGHVVEGVQTRIQIFAGFVAQVESVGHAVPP